MESDGSDSCLVGVYTKPDKLSPGEDFDDDELAEKTYLFKSRMEGFQEKEVAEDSLEQADGGSSNVFDLTVRGNSIKVYAILEVSLRRWAHTVPSNIIHREMTEKDLWNSIGKQEALLAFDFNTEAVNSK